MNKDQSLLRRIVRWTGIVLLCCFLLGFVGSLLLTLLLSLNVFLHETASEISVLDTLGEIAVWICFLLAEIMAIWLNLLVLKRFAKSVRES